MRESADVLVNWTGGERVLINRRAEDELRLTLELSQVGCGPPEHAHPLQEERFTVLSGTLAITVDGEPRELREGHEIAIPPGVRHRWHALQAGTEVAVTMSPALRFETVLERAFELVDEGAVTHRGIADLSAVARFMREFEGEYELVAL